jgi:hypothetical protein
LIDAGYGLSHSTLRGRQRLKINYPGIRQPGQMTHKLGPHSSTLASSLIRHGLFGSPASFTALGRACRNGAIFSAIAAASRKIRVNDLSLATRPLEIDHPRVEMRHRRLKHIQAVQNRTGADRFLGFTDERATRSRRSSEKSCRMPSTR